MIIRVTEKHRVGLTAVEAVANLRTVLELCDAGRLSCSQKTGRPSAALPSSRAPGCV